MYDVAWRGMWICVRSKDAQKQLARTSLRGMPMNSEQGVAQYINHYEQHLNIVLNNCS